MIKMRKTALLFMIIILVAILIFTVNAFSASNSVPVTKLDEVEELIGPNQLKPPECAGLNLTNLIVVSGSTHVNGTTQNDLILGDAGVNDINGRRGNDCIVGGAGDDIILGGQDDDVIIGGDGANDLKGRNGNDTIYGGSGDELINGGNGTDACFGGGGTDDIRNCE